MEEGCIVGRRKLQADAAADHGCRFRVHGEGFEDIQVRRREEVEFYLHVAGLLEAVERGNKRGECPVSLSAQ